MIAGVIHGKLYKPRRVVLHGTHGIGKSTWASKAPSPIFLQIEQGLDDIGADRTPLLTTAADVGRWLIELSGEAEHGYRTVVLDTIDWLEKMIWTAVCQKAKVEDVESFGYGKGYVKAISKWEWVLNALNQCRDRGMNVILLGHSKVEKFSPPDGEPYDRWQLDLHKLAAQLVQEWADEVLFAHYVVHQVTKDQGFNKTRTRAIGDGERIVYTSEHPTHVAKRRIEMPDTLPLEWSAYQQHWPVAPPPGNVSGVVVDGHSKPKAQRG